MENRGNRSRIPAFSVFLNQWNPSGFDPPFADFETETTGGQNLRVWVITRNNTLFPTRMTFWLILGGLRRKSTVVLMYFGNVED